MFKDVIDALNNSLQNIHFPSDPTDLVRVKADFMKVADFPNVVGAIDGTLIPILGMSNDDEHVCVKERIPCHQYARNFNG